MLPVLKNNTAWTPVLGETFNRLDSYFDRLLGEDMPFRPTWGAVPVSLWDDEDNIYVEAELPGMTDRDVEITVHNGMLCIRGERKPQEGRHWLYDGRTYGRFERMIRLPEEVSTDNVQATMKDGVVSITLPKSPEAKPKKIPLTWS
jgi:HSP20 family protein